VTEFRLARGVTVLAAPISHDEARWAPRQTTAAGSGGASFQDTIKRASKTTARIRSSKKAAKITVSRMVPQSDPVSDAPRATIAYCPNPPRLRASPLALSDS
jgi:hypothetical protein